MLERTMGKLKLGDSRASKPKILVPELADAIPAEEVGYCRVSDGRDQDPDFQVALMLKRGIPKANIFVESQSGRSIDNRPQLKKALMLMAERKGWTLVIWKLDRLGRNALDLIQLAQEFVKNEWNLVSLTEQLDTRTAFGRLYFTILAGLAQFESDTTGERTRAGMARRKELGVVIGRRSQITAEQFEEMENLLLKRPTMPIKDIGKRFKVSGSTVNKYFPRWRSKTHRERLAWRREHPLPAWDQED